MPLLNAPESARRLVMVRELPARCRRQNAGILYAKPRPSCMHQLVENWRDSAASTGTPWVINIIDAQLNSFLHPARQKHGCWRTSANITGLGETKFQAAAARSTKVLHQHIQAHARRPCAPSTRGRPPRHGGTAGNFPTQFQCVAGYTENFPGALPVDWPNARARLHQPALTPLGLPTCTTLFHWRKIHARSRTGSTDHRRENTPWRKPSSMRCLRQLCGSIDR